jgi:hypothetical protein
VNRPKNSKVTFPSGGLFTKGGKPKFLGGTTNAVKQPTEKKGFFASLFGKKENKNFIPANKFKNSKRVMLLEKEMRDWVTTKTLAVFKDPSYHQ